METLQGGREGLIFRQQDKVHRPSGFWSKSVHLLLTHLDKVGFDNAPKTYGFDGKNNEILSFVGGDVYNYPLTDNIATIEALTSAAMLLRQYHDATTSFVSSMRNNDLHWMLPSRRVEEVICHGDFAPYNVTLQGKQTVGIFDFDTAHPGPRIWDLSYAVYCWAPFKTNKIDALGDITTQATRAKLFCDSYGLLKNERKKLVDTIIERVHTLVDYMQREAQKGNQAFIDNINDGHHLAYLEDIEYLTKNKIIITEILLD